MAIAILLVARAVLSLMAPFFDRVGRGDSSSHWLDRDTAQPTSGCSRSASGCSRWRWLIPTCPDPHSEAFKGISVLLGLMVTFGGSSLFGQASERSDPDVLPHAAGR